MENQEIQEFVIIDLVFFRVTSRTNLRLKSISHHKVYCVTKNNSINVLNLKIFMFLCFLLDKHHSHHTPKIRKSIKKQISNTKLKTNLKHKIILCISCRHTAPMCEVNRRHLCKPDHYFEDQLKHENKTILSFAFVFT